MAESATFEVREVLRLSSRSSTVFAGRVLTGVVRPGMEVLVELQPQLTCSYTVSAVEYIDRVSVGESLIGLVCAETAPEDAEFVAELCPPGTVVTVNGQPA